MTILTQMGNSRTFHRFSVCLPPMLLCAAAGVLLLPYFSFCCDDAYIYLRYMKNLAGGHGFSWNPGHKTYGITGPLWVLLCTPFLCLFTDPVAALKSVALALSLLFVVLLWSISEFYEKSAVRRFFICLIVVTDPWLIKWGMSGLEVPLTLCLIAGGFRSFLLSIKAHQPPLLGTVLLALATLARPEAALVLSVLLGADAVVNRSLLRTISLGLIAVAIVLPWHLYAITCFGTPIPNTFLAKSGTRPASAMLVKTVTVLVGTYGIPLLCLLIRGFVVRKRRDALPLYVRFVMYWVPPAVLGALAAFYCIRGFPVGARYYLMITPLVVLVGMTSGFRLTDLVRYRWAGLLIRTSMVASAIAINAGIQYSQTWFVTRFPRGMDERLIELGLWLKEGTPPDTIVATDQIGVLGYFGERFVYDTAGLCSPEFIPATGDLQTQIRFMRERKVDVYFHWAYGAEEVRTATKRIPNDWATLLGIVPVTREGSAAKGAPAYCLVFVTKNADARGAGRTIRVTWAARYKAHTDVGG